MSRRKRTVYGYSTFPTWSLIAVLCFFAITIGVIPVRAVMQGFLPFALALQAGVVVLACMAIRLGRQALRERIVVEPGRVLYFPPNGAKPEVIADAELEGLESQYALRLDPLYDLVYRGGQRVNIDPLLLSRWDELSGELRARVAKNRPTTRQVVALEMHTTDEAGRTICAALESGSGAETLMPRAERRIAEASLDDSAS